MNTKCDICNRSTVQDYMGINWKDKYYCISCYELISGKKARMLSVN